MLLSNLWTESGLVNGAMGTIQDILFEEKGPPSLPVAVFVNFDAYERDTITNSEGVKVVPIVPIKTHLGRQERDNLFKSTGSFTSRVSHHGT